MSILFLKVYWLIQNSLSAKADPGPAHRARAPLFEHFWEFVFENFDCITRIFFSCSQHTMFTICISFSTLATITYILCEGASKQSPDPTNSTAPGPRPPVLKFLDQPLRSMLCDEIVEGTYTFFFTY